MTTSETQYFAILRCCAWHVWPEMTVFEADPVLLDLSDDVRVHARIAVLSYLNRSEPTKFVMEGTDKGPLLWTGQLPGHYRVRDHILMAPGDQGTLVVPNLNARRGEIDIMLTFLLDGELPAIAQDTLRSAAFAFMSLLNLKLKDFLTPVAPLQVRKHCGPQGEFTSHVPINIQLRESLTEDVLGPRIRELARTLFSSSDSERLRTALELYGSHFHEREPRVRFLLLVMALETVAVPTAKNPVALRLIDQWKEQLRNEQAKYASCSAEYAALEDLDRELLIRKNQSIRSHIRKMVSSCVSSRGGDSAAIAKRAVQVYDLRSTLVHTGHLDAAEVERGESEAREVLEFVLETMTQPSDASSSSESTPR